MPNSDDQGCGRSDWDRFKDALNITDISAYRAARAAELERDRDKHPHEVINNNFRIAFDNISQYQKDRAYQMVLNSSIFATLSKLQDHVEEQEHQIKCLQYELESLKRANNTNGTNGGPLS